MTDTKEPTPRGDALRVGKVERAIGYAYSRWAVDNEAAAFPEPHVIERIAFAAGYRAALLQALTPQAQGGE